MASASTPPELMTLVMGGTPTRRAPAPSTAAASSVLAVSHRVAVTHAAQRPLTISSRKPARQELHSNQQRTRSTIFVLCLTLSNTM